MLSNRNTVFRMYMLLRTVQTYVRVAMHALHVLPSHNEGLTKNSDTVPSGSTTSQVSASRRVGGGGGGVNGGGGANSFANKPEVKATLTALFIICLYVMAWSPYATMVLLGQLSSHFHSLLTPRATSLPALFAKCASLYNPFV